jgi:hypothetical protein
MALAGLNMSLRQQQHNLNALASIYQFQYCRIFALSCRILESRRPRAASLPRLKGAHYEFTSIHNDLPYPSWHRLRPSRSVVS